MRQLIVAATSLEIAPFLEYLEQLSSAKRNEINILITGIGGVATALQLGKHLSSTDYDRVINVGIAGAYDQSLQLGQVVEIVEDQFGDLGAEDRDGTFIDAFELGIQENKHPFVNQKLTNLSPLSIPEITLVKGITVNKVTGTEATKKEIAQKFAPQTESMESAAFFYSCISFNVPFAAIRSISNYVEPRNRANWKMKLAISNLNKTLSSYCLAT